MKIAASPEEWLRLFHDAKYVVTDSFHGAVFSILFHKDFFVKADGHHINRRVEELLTRLNLTDRIISGTLENETMLSKIDYSYADKQIEKFRKESMEKLSELLK
jgi:exopolysaccharide biosynthesis predicted pyruvyltransferase EpsI